MKILIGVIFCTLALYTVDALKCLQCAGVGYNSCGGKKGKEKSMKPMECEADQNYCYEQREDRDEGVIIISAYNRGCARNDLENGCVFDKEKDVEICLSTCEKDGCNRGNGAGAIQAVVSTISLLLFVTVIFH
ncbi:U-scoloptoxin(05)-Sm1a-like isoform X2 [Glandiceps talaboti]